MLFYEEIKYTKVWSITVIIENATQLTCNARVRHGKSRGYLEVITDEYYGQVRLSERYVSRGHGATISTK